MAAPTIATAPAGRRVNRRRMRWLVHVGLILACLLVTGPILFTLVKATQTTVQVMSPSVIPGAELWHNIKGAWAGSDFGIYTRNSLIIALAVTFGKTLFSLMAGMALVYFRIPFKPIVFGFILLTLMMPTQVLIVGLFDLVSKHPPPTWAALFSWIGHPLAPTPYGFNWSDSYWAIIVPFLASATGVFLFHQHFMSIPLSLADAAKIDGAGPLRFLMSILVPMSTNTIGALAVIQFVYVWNQYLWPLVIIRRVNRQVVQVGLNTLIGTGVQDIQWGVVMAGAILALIPPLIVFMLLQEQFMRGFALSAEK
ncbi:MAG: carbohydrate ABC transporter permease [Deinococcales bacterium]